MHISKDCSRRLSCKVCGSRHPRIFHIHPKKKGAEKNQAVTDTDTAVGSALVAIQTNGFTGVGEHDCKLSIISVKVKSKKGNKIVPF